MLSWGTKPEIEAEIEVNQDYVFQKGEYGKIHNEQYGQWMAIGSNYPSEYDFISSYVHTRYKKDGIEVLYMRVNRTVETDPRSPGVYVRFKIEECIFKGSPFTFGALEIIALGIAFAIIITPITVYLLKLKVIKEAPENIPDIFGAPVDLGDIFEKLGNTAVIGIVLIVLLFVFLSVGTKKVKLK